MAPMDQFSPLSCGEVQGAWEVLSSQGIGGLLGVLSKPAGQLRVVEECGI